MKLIGRERERKLARKRPFWLPWTVDGEEEKEKESELGFMMTVSWI